MTAVSVDVATNTMHTAPVDGEEGWDYIRQLISLCLGDGAEMNENEDRLMSALRDSFASRAELAELKSVMLEKFREWLESFSREFRDSIRHIHDGNGAPGLNPLDTKINAHIAESTRRFEAQGAILTSLSKVRSKWSRLRWSVATATVSLVCGMAIQWGMANKVVAPVAQKAETDQAQVIELKKTVVDLNAKFDEFLKRQPVPAPVVNRYRGRQPVQPVKRRPEPPIGVLKTGDIVDGHQMVVESEFDGRKK